VGLPGNSLFFDEERYGGKQQGFTVDGESSSCCQKGATSYAYVISECKNVKQVLKCNANTK